MNAIPQEVQQAAGLYPGVTLPGAARLMAEYLTKCAAAGAETEEAGTARYGDRVAVFQKLTAAGLFNDRRAGEEVPQGLTVQNVTGLTIAAQVYLRLGTLKVRMTLHADGGAGMAVVDESKPIGTGVLAMAERSMEGLIKPPVDPPDVPLPFLPAAGEVLTAEEPPTSGNLTIETTTDETDTTAMRFTRDEKVSFMGEDDSAALADAMIDARKGAAEGERIGGLTVVGDLEEGHPARRAVEEDRRATIEPSRGIGGESDPNY